MKNYTYGWRLEQLGYAVISINKFILPSAYKLPSLLNIIQYWTD